MASAYLGLSDPNDCDFLDFNLAADPDGAWIVMWDDRSSPNDDAAFLLRTSRSLDKGDTWSTPATAPVFDKDPWGDFSLAPGRDGTWGIVWSTNYATFYADRYETGGQVLVSRLSDDGARGALRW